MGFAIKAEISDPMAETFSFHEQKTMDGGKHVAKGDTIFVFASETQGGQGLIARGIVTSVQAIARQPGEGRQTPCAGITVRRTALATRPLGRRELTPSADRGGGQPGAELHSKFHRQATNKVIGI